MVLFIFIQILIDYSASRNSVDPDQTQRSAVSDLGLHLSNKKDARLIWVKALNALLRGWVVTDSLP